MRTMERILKAATVGKQLIEADDLALINKQTLRELGAEEVFTFRLAACNNQVDRDFERFTDKALEGLASMFVGKTVLMDHVWCAGYQTARVYDAIVDGDGDVKQLMLKCYMPRNEESRKTIDAIETGILKECSIGCAMGSAVCSICGTDNRKILCEHIQGRQYDGQLCVMALDEPVDAYEVSLVAVPAQPEAGVVKNKRYGGAEPQPPESKARDEPPKFKTMMEKLAAMAAVNPTK